MYYAALELLLWYASPSIFKHIVDKGQQGLVVFMLNFKYCCVAFYGKCFCARSCICFGHEKNKWKLIRHSKRTVQCFKMYSKAVTYNHDLQRKMVNSLQHQFHKAESHQTQHFIIIKFYLICCLYCTILYLLYYCFHHIFLMKILLN
jgi:hypothetical protein